MSEPSDKEKGVSEKILITGASGFIGGHVVHYFSVKQSGIYCFVKESSNLEYIKDLSVHFVYGDITDRVSLEKAINGMDCVIHIAAMAMDWGRYQDFYDVNVQGTLNVMKACKNNNVKNIIITGTISSYGEENSKEIKTENYPFNSHYHYFLDSVFPCKMNYYRDTKALSTREAIKYAKENSLDITVLEPVWVFGEFEFNTGFYDYLKSVRSKLPFLPGSRKNKFHVIYADDLARAYYLAFKKNLPGINRILIGNKECDYMNNIFTTFCKALGMKKPKNLPKAFIYPIGFFLELIYTVMHIKQPPMLTRGRVNMFYDNIEYSVHKADSLLSFSSTYSLEEAIKRTVSWYRENNLI